MVTAQNRTMYLDENGNITDQTQASVPICGGDACLEIPSDPPFIFALSQLDASALAAILGGIDPSAGVVHRAV